MILRNVPMATAMTEPDLIEQKIVRGKLFYGIELWGASPAYLRLPFYDVGIETHSNRGE